MQDPQAETQENWAKPMLSIQILPTPKNMNQITNSIFLKGEGMEQRETRQGGMRGTFVGAPASDPTWALPVPAALYRLALGPTQS